MTTEERIALLMANGYTVFIEAKGRGRGFEMSYEVNSSIIMFDTKYPLISFGETLDSALDSLIRQIENLKGEKLELKQEA